MDSLDYGRRFTVDAYRPGAVTGNDWGVVDDYLLELHTRLEGGRVPHDSEVVDDEDGITAATRGSEAHGVLHLFPRLGMVSLHVFSRRDILLSDLTRQLAHHFGVGRFESHLGSATKALPKEKGRLRTALAGDRAYTRVRLDDHMLAFNDH